MITRSSIAVRELLQKCRRSPALSARPPQRNGDPPATPPATGRQVSRSPPDVVKYAEPNFQQQKAPLPGMAMGVKPKLLGNLKCREGGSQVTSGVATVVERLLLRLILLNFTGLGKAN